MNEKLRKEAHAELDIILHPYIPARVNPDNWLHDIDCQIIQAIEPLIRKDEREKIIKQVERFHRDEGGLELHLNWNGIVIPEPDWQVLKATVEGK